MPTCSFCKTQYHWPRGLSIVQKDGSVRYYCSGKCRKNALMGRNNKKLKWAKGSGQISAKVEKEE